MTKVMKLRNSLEKKKKKITGTCTQKVVGDV